jgi:2,5-dihydroxypyridine 5,6-dioxygenase
MLQERIEGKWLGGLSSGPCAERDRQGHAHWPSCRKPSRGPVLVHLCELAAYDLGAEFCMIQMPTPPQIAPRSR